MPIINKAIKYQGYNCWPGCGWRRYGRLIVNFKHNRATSVYFDGELLWERVA